MLNAIKMTMTVVADMQQLAINGQQLGASLSLFLLAPLFG